MCIVHCFEESVCTPEKNLRKAPDQIIHELLDVVGIGSLGYTGTNIPLVLIWI